MTTQRRDPTREDWDEFFDRLEVEVEIARWYRDGENHGGEGGGA